MSEAVSNISKVLADAKAGDGLSKKADKAIEEMFRPEVAGPDDLIKQGFIDEVTRPTTPTGPTAAAPPALKKGRKPGKKPTNSPKSDGIPADGVNRLHRSMETNDYSRAEGIVLTRCRKRIIKYFRHFPHKLVDLFPEGIPMAVPIMGLSDLKKLEEIIIEAINEIDESLYVKWLFRAGAGFIETQGPAISTRFSFLPGIEIIAHQEGLQNQISHAIDVPGEQGLEDEVMKLSIPWTGHSVSNPALSIGQKFYDIMRFQEKQNLQNIKHMKPEEGAGL